jgi:hypothetical protein
MGGKFDELIEMGRLVDEVGDEFPTPEGVIPQAAPEATGQQADVVQVMDAGVEQVEIPDMESAVSDGHFSIDQALGLVPKPAPTPEPKAEVTEPPAPAAGSGAAPSGLEERLSELAAENRRLREITDTLTRRALSGEPAPGAAPEGEAFEKSPEVMEYFRQYGVVTKEDLADLQQAVEPLRQQREDQQIAEFVALHVDGFKAEHMPVLYSAIKTMSDEQKARYAGVQGAALLASSLVSRGALDLGTEKNTEEPSPRPSPLLARHHSEAAGGRDTLHTESDEVAKLRALEKMPDDEFLRMLNNIPR